MLQPLKTGLSALLVLLALSPTLHAERWQTLTGQAHDGDITGVYGPIVVISGKNRTNFLKLDDLESDSLARVADYLAATPAQAPRWSESDSVVAKSLRNRLQVWDDAKGKLVDYSPGDRPEPEFYLAYFSAHWCGPCRRFTPELIKAYRELKSNPGYASAFELVFISSDRDSAEQATYVRETGMPWPLVRYSQLGRVKPLERWEGSGIPCLVAVTRKGELLFHSYNGDDYVGPDDVLAKFSQLLTLLDLTTPAARKSRHKLAVVQHVRANAAGKYPPKPYLLNLNPSNYQRLAIKAFEARLTVDAAGRVSDVTTVPALDAVYRDQFLRDAESWLFLPAVENGQPLASSVKLPIQF